MAGIEGAPQDRGGGRMLAEILRLQPAIGKVLGVGGTLVALGLVIHELSHQELTPLTLLAGSGFGFWAALITSLMVEPVTDYFILRRLLGSGIETLAPLVHKQSLNALLFGYAGDSFFVGWLRRHVGNARSALGLVCDMAIVSALINNVAALGMLFLMWRPIQSLSGVRIDGRALFLASTLVAVPLILMVIRRKKLPGAGLPVILAYKSLRTVIATILVALTWHYAMPAVPLLSWLLLMTGRMIVSRLPIVPNKDLAFAGCAAIFLGPNDQVVPVIAGIALITLGVQAAMITLVPLFLMPRKTVPCVPA
ncbi:hypothetical protein BH10PSE13_BH10PSE13_20470 [soil metagenome]